MKKDLRNVEKKQRKALFMYEADFDKMDVICAKRKFKTHSALIEFTLRTGGFEGN